MVLLLDADKVVSSHLEAKLKPPLSLLSFLRDYDLNVWSDEHQNNFAMFFSFESTPADRLVACWLLLLKTQTRISR